VNEQPGGLTVTIADRSTKIAVTAGGVFTLPLGSLTLLEGPLEGADPPTAVHLANALGMVQDHFDDIVIEAPTVAAAPSVVASGRHALALAHAEVGKQTLPPNYRLRRSDADELFRTLVAEPIAQRQFNPGLDRTDVESIIGTCCVILGIMRRLDIQEVAIQEVAIQEVPVEEVAIEAEPDTGN
jgi:exopolyphosphatase/pppGpp-phosphohydrolase